MTRDDVVARIAAVQGHTGRRRAPGAALGQMLHDDTPLTRKLEQAPRRGDHDLNDDGMRPKPPLMPAAVLIPLVERAEGYTVLLTERAADLSHHAGQISFPGGRIEEEDESPEHAALREAQEEIGLDDDFVDLVGRLDVYETRTGFEVFPIVGLVRPGFRLTLDDSEVAMVFEMPLSFVLDPENHERHSREFYGRMRHFYVLPYKDHYVWGATAGMLINLYEVLTGEKAAWR